MTSKRELERRLGSFEIDHPEATTSIEWTPALREACLEVIRYRQRNEEVTPSMVHEAIEHMDDDLAAAIREADLRQ